MKITEEFIASLSDIAGVKITTTPRPLTLGEVFSEGGKTYFAVDMDTAGVLDGDDKKTFAIAALCREVVKSHIFTSEDDEIVAYMSGKLAPAREISFLNAHKLSGDYYVLAIRVPKSKTDEVHDFLNAVMQGGDYLAFIEDTFLYARAALDGDDYKSAGAFADVLIAGIKEEMRLDVKIGVGGVARSFEEIKDCFSYAKYALLAGEKLDPDGAIFHYQVYAVVKLLSSATKSELKQFTDSCVSKRFMEVLHDDVMMRTVDTFFKNTLNVSEASRVMYMHRNTLIYRLDKLERATGLDIRNFNDAVTLKLIIIIAKLAGEI